MLSIPRRLSYVAQAAEALARRSMRMANFLSLTCKLVHAAQYRPTGRPYLTCMFTALRQASRSGRSEADADRQGRCRDLWWWRKALAIPNDGVAFPLLSHFPPSSSAGLLEFAYDAPGTEDAGTTMLRDDGDGHRWCVTWSNTSGPSWRSAITSI